MQSSIPKQFLDLCGKPVLMHTIEAFKNTIPHAEIIVVLPDSLIDLWKDLCVKHNYNITHTLCFGGKTRFHSVSNGLALINEICLIAVHDAVRPLVSARVIAECFEAAAQYGCAVPVVSIKDSIRFVDKDKSYTHNRENYRAVQTPQCFKSEILLKAYHCDYNETFTDDASVVEALGFEMKLLEGNDENIKITTPLDLIIAEAIIKHKLNNCC